MLCVFFDTEPWLSAFTFVSNSLQCAWTQCSCNGFRCTARTFVTNACQSCRCTTSRTSDTACFFIVYMSTVMMDPFSNRKIIYMTFGTYDNESFRYQTATIPFGIIAFSSVRPLIRIAFRLLCKQTNLFHGSTERTIIPSWESNGRYL